MEGDDDAAGGRASSSSAPSDVAAYCVLPSANNNGCEGGGTSLEQRGPYLQGPENLLGAPEDIRQEPINDEGAEWSSTIGFEDFTSLISPGHVDKCLCCSISLFESSPPSLVPERKAAMLQSLCDILNLPCNFKRSCCVNEETEDITSTEFPFCLQCSNTKITRLILIHEKLAALQSKFENLKKEVLNDLLRVFVCNVLNDKKVPVHVMREAKVFDRMLFLFNKHVDRRKASGIDSEVQTELSFSPDQPTIWSRSNESEKFFAPKRRRANPRKNELSVNKTNPARKTSRSTTKYDINEPFIMNGAISVSNENSMDANSENQCVSQMEQFVPQKTLGLNGINSFNVNQFSPFQDTITGEEFVTVEVPMESEVVAKKSSPYEQQDIQVRAKERRSKITQCEVCLKSVSRSAIKQHMETIHGDVKPYQCRGCDKRFGRRDHFVEHEDRHENNFKRLYYCHRCRGEIDLIVSKSSYVKHCVDYHKIEDNVVEFFHHCDAEECLDSFKVKEDYINHIKSHWDVGESFQCSICEKLFATNLRLRFHEKQAHRNNEPYYDCQFCYMGFDSEEDFSRHVLFHKVKIPEEDTHICDICGKSFLSAHRLKRHKYSTHDRNKGKYSKAGTTMTNKISVAELSPICDVSNQTVTSNSQDGFENENIIPKIKVTVKEPKLYTCQDCGKTYSDEKRFKKHQIKHPSKDDPDFELDNPSNQCSESSPKRKRKRKKSYCLDTKSTLNSSCMFCSRKWRSKQEARRHMVMSHKEEYVKDSEFCDVCFELFPSRAEVDKHFEEAHSKFKCHICQKQCPTTYSLNAHMRCHFKRNSQNICCVCQMTFASKIKLYTHVRQSHPDSMDAVLKMSYSSLEAGTPQESSDSLLDTVDDVDGFYMQ